MSSSALSNILQNDAEILKKQWQEMQQRHEEEQQLLAQLYYDLKLKGLSNRTTLVLSNTRELDRVLNTK